MPALSIIIPTLNSAKTLEIALESILQQNFADFEIIIVDGVSTDNTLDIAHSCNDDRIKIISEKDSGIYDAMNKGVVYAKGNWLYFMGSDDKMCPNILNSIFPYFANNVDYIYGNVIFKKSQIIYCGSFNRYKLIKQNICHQSILFNKKIFDILGLYEKKYLAYADWHYNMRVFNNKQIKKIYINQNIAVYDEEGQGSKFYDRKFYEDLNDNIKKLFPFHVKFLLSIRKLALIGYFIDLMIKKLEK